MVSTYTPTYYTSVHDSIASICKTILPFSFKKRRIPAIAAAEHRLSKEQSDNLKWQQDSFHQMLNLMGLCKEGIVPENEVAAFRTHLLETLIASPLDHEPPLILRDKLIFLQELLYAECISEEEYHASKRPLLQRLAVQGAEIDARDVIVGAHKETSIEEEEWSVIDLKDDKCSNNCNTKSLKNILKERSTVRRMKGAASVFGFVSSDKNAKLKENNVNSAGSPTRHRNVSITGFAGNVVRSSTQNPFGNGDVNENENDSKSILMEDSLPPSCMVAEKQRVSDKAKKKPFRPVSQTVQEGSGGGSVDPEDNEKSKPGKRAWVFDGFKKWKKNDFEDGTAPFSSSLDEKSDEASFAGKLVINPVGEGPDTKQIKRKLHPNGAPTDFFVDKVLAENIRKRLSQIKTEVAAKDPDIHLTDDQIEAISTRLPVDKADLKMCFPKTWCDRYGDMVLDVVRKEFKDHMREMGNQRSEKHTFDYENLDPNRRGAPQRQSTLTV